MVLCIDTISEAAGITLVDGTSAFHLPLDPQNSSESIIPVIDEVLTESGATLSDIQAVLVIKGPGSFTGLRVGISVANQFAHQLKIPIFGYRTDEWWLARSEDSDALYLQSMNKAEVYAAKHGEKFIRNLKDLSRMGSTKWLGQVSEMHRSQLPSGFAEIKELFSVEETWKRLANESQCDTNLARTYDLVEPFYGKAPTITKGKSSAPIPAQQNRAPSS